MQEVLLPSQFGPAHTMAGRGSGNWQTASSSRNPDDPLHSRVGNGMAPPNPQPSWRPIPPAMPQLSSPTEAGPAPLAPETHLQKEARKRSVTRDLERPYLREMAQAHAENREPRIEIPVCSAGKVLGLLSPWQRVARLSARQTFNYKVRSYKAKREYWESQVQCVAEKLAQKFTYSRPLDIGYLGKFLKNTFKNDRKQWKKHFIATSGLRHPRCPVEAFTEWKKYWVSEAGREESAQMTEMRKGKNKAHRTDPASFIPRDTGNGHLHSEVCHKLP